MGYVPSRCSQRGPDTSEDPRIPCHGSKGNNVPRIYKHPPEGTLVLLYYIVHTTPSNSIPPSQRRHGSSEIIPGSIVSLSVIKQMISALEYHRFQHQHTYKHIPESQVGLRHDTRICRFESAAKHDELKRVESTQVLKAAGSSSSGY